MILFLTTVPWQQVLCNKAGMLDDRLHLFRLFSVINFVGRSFLTLFGFTSVVKRYVCGESKEIVGGKRKLDRDEAGFVGEVQSLFCLFPELGDVEQHFKQFNDSVSTAVSLWAQCLSHNKRLSFLWEIMHLSLAFPGVDPGDTPRKPPGTCGEWCIFEKNCPPG